MGALYYIPTGRDKTWPCLRYALEIPRKGVYAHDFSAISRYLATRFLVAACLLLCTSAARAQEQWKYTAMGDSLSTGYRATQGYVPTYQSDVQTDTGVTVTLYNLGQNGWTSGNLRTALQTDSVFQNAVLQSNVITWDIGLNDFRNARTGYKHGGCGGPDGQNCLRSAVATFKSNWDGIVQEVLLRRSPLSTIIRTIDVYNPWVTTDKATNSVGDKKEPAYAKGTDFQVLKYYLDQINNHIAVNNNEQFISVRESPCRIQWSQWR